MLVTGVAVDSTGQRTTATLEVGIGEGGNWWDKPVDASNSGYRNAPGYPGALTPGPRSVQSGQTYQFMDFVDLFRVAASDGGPVHDVTFVGCRFHGPNAQQANVVLYGDGPIEFDHCTFEPDVPFSPGVWISEADSYQYAIEASGAYGSHSAGLTMRYCDIWGCGNAIDINGSGPFLFDHVWIHDMCLDPAASYHTDGIGYLNGIDGDGIRNMTVQDCTIDAAGNTNGIACQKGSYDNLTFRRNYFGGWGFTVAIWSGATGITFTDNVFSTEFNCIWGALYGTNFMDDPGSTWARNRWHSKDPATSGPLGWGDPDHDGLFWYYTPGADISGDTPPVTQTDDSIFISTTDYPILTPPR